jgi:hypothetical protein
MSVSTTRFKGLDCFNWDDQRGPGCHSEGIVTHIPSQTVYASGDSDQDIRLKMVALSLGQAPIMSIRMLGRIGAIFRGDFVRAGRHFAEKAWKLERQTWSLNPNPKALPPDESSLRNKVILHTIWQLIKNIVKIVTYPLAMIALQFAALYGIINPADGRRMFSAIEHAWSRDYFEPDWCWQFLDYLAPCMQPKDVWESRNFYAAQEGHDSGDYRSILLNISNKIKDNIQFYERETYGFGHSVAEFVPILAKVKQKITKLVQNFQNSTEEQIEANTKTMEKIESSLRTIETSLNLIPQIREAIVNLQIQKIQGQDVNSKLTQELGNLEKTKKDLEKEIAELAN